MHSLILDQELQTLRFTMDEIVKDLHQIAIDIGNHELAGTISELRNRINEPFMFVIVGEVKAGKSSFINALLQADKEIAKVAPDPCTDVIQQVMYGTEEKTIVINQYLQKILYPVDILKEISIVDTPGTNTIIEHHQEITENFIPSSDLIVFVFEAKNPYRQSAWQFFDYIHKEWRKKIIFILQQADLMSADDLQINYRGVLNHAEKKGIEKPQVFAVSAKLEQEGKTEESGFPVLRNFIQENITGGKAPLLKLENNLELANTINHRLMEGLRIREEQLRADETFRTEVKESLQENQLKADHQVDILVENLLAVFDRETAKTEKEIFRGLGFFRLTRRSISSIFNKKESIQEWLRGLLKDLDASLSKEFQHRLGDGVNSIADSIQQMAKLIDLKIKNSKTILKHNHDIFGNIADRRSVVLLELQEKFASFIKREQNFIGEEVFNEEEIQIAPNLMTGSGIAAIGVVLATVTQGMVLDITGGVLTALGFIFAGITVSFKRRRLLKNFREEIESGRNKLEREIEEKLKAYIRLIGSQIDGNFKDFDAMLELENKQLLQLVERQNNITHRLQAFKDQAPTTPL